MENKKEAGNERIHDDLQPGGVGMSPQQRTILHYMWSTGRPLTDYDCTTILKICKLSTRISELRADGWDLPHKMVKNEINSGKHAVYYMSADDMERYHNDCERCI